MLFTLKPKMLVLCSLFISLFSIAQQDSIRIKNLLDTSFVYERKDHERSFRSAQEALQLSEKNKYYKGASAAHRQIGLIYYNKGSFEKAINEFVAAIKIAEQHQLITEQARAYLHIGLVYLDMTRLKEAMDNFAKGKALCEHYKIERGLPNFLLNIGIVHDISKNYDSALYYFNSAKVYYEKINDIGDIANIENNIGNVFKRQGQYAKAKPHYLVSLHLNKQLQDMYLPVNYANLAETDEQLGNHASALAYIDSAIFLAKELGSDKIMYDCLLKKQLICEQQGNYKGSNECFKQMISLKDSMLNKDIETAIIDTQTKYESEKKEAENKLLKQEKELSELKIEEGKKQSLYLFIGLGLTLLMLLVSVYAYRIKIKSNKILRDKNEQINKQNSTLKTLNHQLIESEEALQASNHAKDRLLSVVSHDISNPVKALSNYTSGTLGKSNTLSREELQEALQKTNNALVPLQNMVSNLLNWSHIQKNGLHPQVKTISLNTLIEECIFIYANTANEKNISIQSKIPANTAVQADSDMMQVIVRNLLSNALKFSPANSTVQLAYDAGTQTLKVSDSGQGMNPEQVAHVLKGANTQSSYGTDNEKGIGMGLHIVFDCIQAQGFRWNIHSEPGKGSSFEIHLS